MHKQINQFDISAENEAKAIIISNQYRIRKILKRSKIKIAKRLWS